MTRSHEDRCTTSKCVKGSRQPRRAYYRHTALDTAREDALRLLYVRPQLQEDGFIELAMYHLDMRSRYSALSYVWGRADETRTILINGRYFEVGMNLWSFLNSIRCSSPSRVLWIDAICIDQNNMEEKNEQVQKMGRIYRQADEVLAWLGTATTELNHLMDKIPHYAELSPEDMLLASSQDHVFWDGYKQVEESEYWQRAWTAQEYLLPKRGRLMASSRTVQISDFATLLRCSQLAKKRREQKLRHRAEVRSTSFHDLEELRDPCLNNSLGCDGWWKLTRHRKCSDVRDRVFATLSLKEGHGLRINYALNPLELFLEALWLGKRLSFRDRRSSVLRADVAKELSNMLEITPASLILYSSHKNQLCSSTSRSVKSSVSEDARLLHRRAAVSDADRARWLNALKCLPGSHDFNPPQHWVSAYPLSSPIRDKYGRCLFPSDIPRPVDLESAPDPRSKHAGFRLLLTTVREHRTRRFGEEEIHASDTPYYDHEDWEFLNRKCSWCPVTGIYHTTCVEVPRRVYYMLIDQSSPEYKNLTYGEPD